MTSVQGVAAQVNAAVRWGIGAGSAAGASQGPPDTLRLEVAPGTLRSATAELAASCGRAS